MQFILRLFPEITIKSNTVRKSMIQQLANNLKKLMVNISDDIEVKHQWDNIRIENVKAQQEARVVDVLKSTPGISNFVRTQSHSYTDLHDIYEKTAEIWGPLIKDHTFVVRCKRVGKHDYSSTGIAQYVGGGLHQNFPSNGVDLNHADITINIEVRHDTLIIIEEKHEGLGGFPMGSQDAVLSLISGGFDSSVSSYAMMSRGLKTHFLFFNLGGAEHEVGVKEVAYYLWNKFGSTHKVKFITVNFEEVVEEILNKVADSQMGVVLKRMFLRAATEVAKTHKLEALVTGEAIAQVSSQTLPNLAIIDQVTNMLVLRPLITTHKTDIIGTARQIGTEDFAASMPEYCGVISVKPTTHARQHKIEAEEAKFDFAVLDRAVANAKVKLVEKLGDLSKDPNQQLELYGSVPDNAVVVDIRHPNEEDLSPLEIDSEVIHIPFYELHRRAEELDPAILHLLY